MQDGGAVLGRDTFAGFIPIEDKNDQQRRMAAAVGDERAKHVVEQVLETWRNDRDDTAIGTWQRVRHDDLRPAQAVEQLCGRRRRLVHLRIEPDRVRVLPMARADDQVQVFGAGDIGYQRARWFPGLDVGFRCSSRPSATTMKSA